MTPLSRLRVQAAKEARELVPAFAACAATVWVTSTVLRWHLIAALAYAFGAAGLGALAIGHEFSGRTLQTLLTQPVTRRRLLAVKFGVLSLMVLAIGVLFARVGSRPAFARDLQLTAAEETLAFVVPILAALFTAPVITMWTASPAAGAVFSLSLVAMPMSVTVAFNTLRATAIQPPRVAIWSGVAAGVAAAVVAYRTFVTLEAHDGAATKRRARAFSTERRQFAEPAGRRNPYWLLVKKELRLQRMTLVLAALYPIGWLVARTMVPRAPGALSLFYIGSTFHCVEIALLSGGVASADERQAGTLEWQLLMPIASWQQWLVKAAVVGAMTLALGCLMPAVASALAPAADLRAPRAADFVSLRTISTATLIAAISLYVSSVSRSGLRALFGALPAVTALAAMIAVADARNWLAPDSAAAALAALAGAAGLVWSAMRNHQRADPRPLGLAGH